MKGTIHMTFSPNPDSPEGTIVDVEPDLRDIDPFCIADALAFVASRVSATSDGLAMLCSSIVTLAAIKFKDRETAKAGDPDKAEEPTDESEEEPTDE